MAAASSEAEAKSVVEARERIVKQEIGFANLEALKARVSLGSGGVEACSSDGQPKKVLKIRLLVKCDVAGSAEAVRAALEDLQQSDDSALCAVDIVSCGLGDVTAYMLSFICSNTVEVLSYYHVITCVLYSSCNNLLTHVQNKLKIEIVCSRFLF